ncbi:hypothetical protein [Iamia sp.]|uniref:hypothetical protein n=1 Tax=Iamia sp. TaxID=2722710 RepID=UPI002C16E20D|nr:hypothetical protein [Iamia sp.]HXH58914.1 hypothetical protein [Iamia sp.]
MTAYPRHLAVGALPRADQALADAITQLHRPPVLRCAHATHGAAFVCAQHPAAGIMCWGCSLAHTDRHTYEVEHRCDECGTDTELLHPIAGTATVTVLTTDTHGDGALFVGTVIAIALGVCPPCATRRGVTR